MTEMLIVGSIGRKLAGKVDQVPPRAPCTEEHAVTVFRYYSEGGAYHHVLDGVANTVWCQASCGMLKHPPPGRVTAREGFDMCSTVPLEITEITRDFNLNQIWVIG